MHDQESTRPPFNQDNLRSRGETLKMRNFLKYLAAGTVALQLATPAFAADMRLKFAGVFPVDHQGSKMMEQVKADIEADLPRDFSSTVD